MRTIASPTDAATSSETASNLHQWLRLDGARIRYPRKHEIAADLATHGDLSVISLSVPERQQLDNDDNRARAERVFSWLGESGTTLLTLADCLYPPRLLETARPPLLLYVTGCSEILSAQQIAIVGSRHPTHSGLETASDFASSLAKGGFVVTSGLARGIDGAAHRGCLDAGVPTIAVAATGLDRVYPPEHGDLAHDIVGKGGAIISEFGPGVAPRAQNFPRRNRIISGLSVGTLVVEAAIRSGSLITARFASEQGREVFAIPGSIHNPAARGCHHLIRQGAKLVEQVDDILEELNWLTTPAPLSNAPAMDAIDRTTPEIHVDENRDADDPDGADINGTSKKGGIVTGDHSAGATDVALEPNATRVLECVDFDPTDAETVVRRSGLSASEVSAILVTLELRGLVCKSAGFFNRRRTNR